MYGRLLLKGIRNELDIGSMSTITDFLKQHGVEQLVEGHCQQVEQQVIDMTNIVTSLQKEKIRVLEIGFNGGHSAEMFLQIPGVSLVSFDIGMHRHVFLSKQYMDIVYPNRHTLILGNSIHTIPTYAQDHPAATFDIIFIDGNHEYDVVKVDLENCRQFAHSDTIVILDDTIHHTAAFEAPWNIGPTRAWKECIENHKIVEIATKDYEGGKGISWGKYIVA